VKAVVINLPILNRPGFLLAEEGGLSVANKNSKADLRVLT